jgi:glyoxylase-like metal-dependent hydrolase (beta-lactamase superfamily II)
MFDAESSSFTYLLAERRGGGALQIDPVLSRVPQYLQLLRELDLRLVMAIDSHLHADHVTGMGVLARSIGCATAMGEQSRVEGLTTRFADGEVLRVDGLELQAWYTPGHTDDAYSFVMRDRVFTGDTLLIRGTGRTDFQNGDAGAQYDSLFGRLLKLPDETRVFPAHDYAGQTSSTIGEERLHNPRLQVASRAEYIAQMDALNLAPPRLIDVAVPANRMCGLREQVAA